MENLVGSVLTGSIAYIVAMSTMSNAKMSIFGYSLAKPLAIGATTFAVDNITGMVRKKIASRTIGTKTDGSQGAKVQQTLLRPAVTALGVTGVNFFAGFDKSTTGMGKIAGIAFGSSLVSDLITKNYLGQFVLSEDEMKLRTSHPNQYY